MENTGHPSRITVFGLGYVGCVTAACLASLDHFVIGVGSDQHKIDCVRNGHAPFYEPGLEKIIQSTVRSGHLSVCNSAGDALRVADIASRLSGRSKSQIVTIRSTVFSGTCEDVVIPEFAGQPQVTAV